VDRCGTRDELMAVDSSDVDFDSDFAGWRLCSTSTSINCALEMSRQ
jgi:hypothetical protein